MMQGIITAILLLAFFIGVIWLFVIKRKRDFDAAARLPLEDNESEKNP